ncbi:hypothetical protein GCM10012278_77140 [Nonomuraea glycinis]|uniref:Uncharacterized protein n=1 Tax=Nonomuraea glycinis TaxID=2047744 RepID=A0A918ADW3_9ACTN|nr:hypothetical protein GCM10012278_77140 [Nonomuraea glycinis]
MQLGVGQVTDQMRPHEAPRAGPVGRVDEHGHDAKNRALANRVHEWAVTATPAAYGQLAEAARLCGAAVRSRRWLGYQATGSLSTP